MSDSSAQGRRPGATSLLLLICVLGLGLRLTLIGVIPPGKGMDEPAHFNYVRCLWREQSLPVQEKPFEPGFEEHEYYQPPLYYGLAAVWGLGAADLDCHGAMLAVRALTPFLALIVVLLSFAYARFCFPGRGDVAWAAAVFVALLPAFASITSTVSNDALAAAVIAAALLALVRAMVQDSARWRWTLVGVLFGLGMWVKSSAVVIAPLAILAGVLRDGRRRGWRRLRGPAQAILIGLVIASPWLVRSGLLYGRPLAVEAGSRPAERAVSAGLLWKILKDIVRSFWSAYGSYNEIYSPAMDKIFAGVSVLAAVGFLLFVLRRRREMGAREWKALIFSVAAFGLMFFLGVCFGVRYVHSQERFLFPVLPAIALLAALGWAELLRPSWRRFLAVGLALFLIAANVYLIFGCVRRAFGPISRAGIQSARGRRV